METTSEPAFNLKHRVTGALILLAWPVLLLPWLLGGQTAQETVHEPAAFLEPKSEFNSSIGPSPESQAALAKPQPHRVAELFFVRFEGRFGLGVQVTGHDQGERGHITKQGFDRLLTDHPELIKVGVGTHASARHY